MGKGPVRSCLSSYCSCSRSEFSQLLSTSWVRGGVYTTKIGSTASQDRSAHPKAWSSHAAAPFYHVTRPTFGSAYH